MSTQAPPDETPSGAVAVFYILQRRHLDDGTESLQNSIASRTTPTLTMTRSDCMTSTTGQVELFSLETIASWQLDPQPQVSVPALQRGLVWEPQQIEFLWDSIMRGFPIGAIILAPRLEGLKDRDSAIVKQAEMSSVGRWHLLDGQQRCNAIAWGFVNPWESGDTFDQILWIDLAPEHPKPQQSREYLFRVTTRAHPWGFGSDDNSSLLSVAHRREFMRKAGQLRADPGMPSIGHPWPENGRPLPQHGLPVAASFPIPFALLWKHTRNDDGRVNWEELAAEPAMQWVSTWCNGKSIVDLNADQRAHIETGLAHASKAKLIALLVPEISGGVSQIEQIFVRLNRQGSPLSADDLAFTLIKAHWSDVDGIIDRLPRHAPPARMVNMALRVAMTQMTPTPEKFARALSIEQVRRLFSSSAQDPSANQTHDCETVVAIKRYFESDLGRALMWIDANLLYSADRPFGIPKYLRSSIAWSSPTVFAWLMYQAAVHGYSKLAEPSDAKRMLAIALALHWFGEDKDRAVDKLTFLGGLPAIAQLIDTTGQRTLLYMPRRPCDLAKIIHATKRPEDLSPELLQRWENMWQGAVNLDATGQPGIGAKPDEGHFMNRVYGQREFLVYAQREYIESCFDGFDPSNPLMWKGHNRPWDYDHILATARLDGRSGNAGPYHKVSKVWQNTIGNLIALDLAKNRSAGDVSAKEKQPHLDEIGKEAFLESSIETFTDFDVAKTHDIVASQRFVHACQQRMIAIYDDWFVSLAVSDLLGPSGSANASPATA